MAAHKYLLPRTDHIQCIHLIESKYHLVHLLWIKMNSQPKVLFILQSLRFMIFVYYYYLIYLNVRVMIFFSL